MKSLQTIILFFALFLFGSNLSPAQTNAKKKIPRSQTLPPPAQTVQDTTVTEQRKERLELPDVLILGKAANIRKPEHKMSFTRVSILNLKTLKVPRSIPVPSSYSSPEQTPSFEPVTGNRTTGLEIRFGTYNTTYLNFNHLQKINRLKIDFYSEYNRSDGQFNNSQFENWLISMTGEYQYSARHAFFAGGNYLAKKYGLWTYSDYQRQFHIFDVWAGVKGRLANNLHYQFRFDLNKTPLQKNIEISPPIHNLILNRENNQDLAGELTYRSTDWQLQLQSRILFNSFYPYKSGEPVVNSAGNLLPTVKNRFSTVQLAFSRYLPRRGFITFGALYDFYRLDLFSKKASRLNPFVKLSWLLSPRWRVYAKYAPHYKFISNYDLLTLNPFYYTESSHNPVEDYRQSFDIGAEWTPFAYGSVRFTYQYRSVENFLIWQSSYEPFWQKFTPSHLFKLNGLEKVHLSWLKVDFLIGSTNSLQIQSSLTLLNSGIDALGDQFQTPTVTSDLPYFEDVSWPTEFRYRLAKNWTATMIAHYFGPRTFSLTEPERGKSIWLLNAKIEYRISGINFYLFARNLLNQKYQIWQNYPETGAQIFAGIEMKL